MPTPISLDLRERIIEAADSGSSNRQAARGFAISPSAAVKLMQQVEATGSSTPGQSGGRRPLLLEPHADTLKAMVEAERDNTLVEIQAKLERRLGMTARGLDHPPDAAPARPAA